MSKILKTASAVAIALTTMAAVVGTDVTQAFDNGANAQVEAADTTVMGDADTKESYIDIQDEVAADVESVDADASAEKSEEADAAPLMVQPLPASYYEPKPEPVKPAKVTASSLRDLMREYSSEGSLSKEMHCLAGTVYFESKGESLKGQLAVARVVIARTESSRFPNSYCGVVYQRSQFSFIRRGKMPRINKSSKAWNNAVKIARIANDEAWKSDVEGALFFHAKYVSPGWRLTRMATIDNHIFYR